MRPLPAGCLTAVLAVALSAAAWVFHGPVWAALRDHPYFAIEHLVIRGCGPRLSEDAVRDWLGLHDGASMWDASPTRVKARLEAHPFIARAAVRRRFPDDFEIDIRERRPEAIVVLDRLYYVDRSGSVFGPLSESDSRDYPVITGLSENTPGGQRAWALRRALQLVRRCQRGRCFAPVSEVHIDPKLGAVLYPAAPPVPIVLGWGSTGEKLSRAARVLQRWEGEGSAERLQKIDLRFRNQVVVKLRTPPAAEPRRAGAGGKRV